MDRRGGGTRGVLGVADASGGVHGSARGRVGKRVRACQGVGGMAGERTWALSRGARVRATWQREVGWRQPPGRATYIRPYIRPLGACHGPSYCHDAGGRPD